MRLVSAWLKVVFPQCVLAFSWDLLLVAHEVIVYQLWLHLCNPLHAWQLVSCSIGNPWGLPEWSRYEVQFVGSSGWCRVKRWCCRVWWHPDVSFLLCPLLGWCVACSPEWHIWWHLKHIICTKVSCCVCCIAIRWFALFLILLTSLVLLFLWASLGHLLTKVEGFSWYVC